MHERGVHSYTKQGYYIIMIYHLKLRFGNASFSVYWGGSVNFILGSETHTACQGFAREESIVTNFDRLLLRST